MKIEKPDHSEMLKMPKMLRFLNLISVLILFSGSTAFSQCSIETEWTFDPPIPSSGAYDAGTVLTLCGEVTAYTAGGANWLSGMAIVFPPAWDAASITNIVGPTGCGTGEWVYLETLTCGGLVITNPGFYYDSNVAGPQDGNPCNNWGDGSNPCGGWSFCFDVTLDAECGGGTNPFDGTDITPAIQAYSDSEVGSWGTGTGCAEAEFVDGPIISIDLDCCDAESGEEPAGPVNICGNTPFNLLTLLGPPIDAGGTWTGPAGWTVDGLGNPIFNPSTNPNISDPAGDYTYEVTGSDGCLKTSTITMQFIDLGLQSTNSLCEGTALLIDLWLNPSIPLSPGGIWTFPNGTIVPGGQVDNTTSPSGIYTYNYVDAGGCPTTISMQLNVSSGGAVGFPANNITVCLLDPPFAPFDSLLGTPASLSGSWVYFGYTPPPAPDDFLFFSGTGDATTWALNPADYNNGAGDPMVDGYVVYYSSDPACGFAQDTIFISVGEVFDAGLFTSPTICESDAPVTLETLLLGTPTFGGDWVDINGNPISNLFNPAAVDPDSTYTLIYSGGFAGTSCFNSQVMQLTVLSNFTDAGNPMAVTVCETQLAFSMTDTLNETGTPQPGGIWTGPLGYGGGEFFVPGSDPAGVYTYTISSPCGSDSNTLTINVITLANAGTDGTLNICPAELNVPLISGLGGAPQGGGFWTLSGIPVPPTVNGNTVADGAVYQYSVGTGTCADFSEVTISLQPGPFAGVLTAVPQEFCQTDAGFSLNTLFTTPPSILGDFWTGPLGPVAGSTFNPATAGSGNYTYTATNSCGSDDVTIFISIETSPNAGISGPLVVCDNGTVTIDLFASLGAGVTTGGTWTGPAGWTLTGGNPIFDPTSDPAGAYAYTVQSLPNNLCTATATINASYIATGDAGLDNTIAACETDATFNMLDSLNGTPDGGGDWFPSGPLFNPTLSAPGAYTYLITNPGCASSVSTLTVNLQSPPDAGQNTVVTLCESLGNIDLTAELNGTPIGGGVWTDVATGTTVSNPYNLAGSCGSSVSLEYTVNAGICSSSSILDLTIQCPPNAGANVATTQCADNSGFDLFSILDPTADAGSFTNTTTGLAVPGGIVTLSAGAAGSYTFTVPGGVCPDDIAFYTLNLQTPISVVVDAQCTPSQTQYIVTLTVTGGDGNYNVTGLPGGPFVGNTYASLPITAGNTYSFSVDDTGPCAPFVQAVTPSPNCACAADAEFVDTSVDICEGGTANIELNFPAGAPTFTIDYTDGTNTFTNQGPFTTGDFLQVTPAVSTTYTLTAVSDQNCTTSVNDFITVNVETTPDAGIDVSLDLCGSGGIIVLPSLIDASADQPGVFTNSLGAVVTNIPQTSAASDVYTYTVFGTQCPNATATYTLNIIDPINVTVVSAACNAAQTAYTVTLEISGGDGNYTVTDIVGTLNTSVTPNVFTSSEIATGTTYSYTVSDTGPCPDVSAGPINSPNCSCPASANFVDNTIAICQGSLANIELNFPSGSPTFTIDYSDGTNTFTNQGPFISGDFLQVTPVTTTVYTLTGVNDQNCSTSVSDVVTVTVETIPDAGPDVPTLDFCGSGGVLVLSSIIDAAADQPGIFTNSGGTVVATVPQISASSGTYIYTVSGTQCPNDAASYTLNIIDPITVNVVSAVCNLAQTAYTVTLEISGGDGSYVVTNLAGSINTSVSPAVFTSNPITTGTPYSYTVSDTGPCPDVVAGPINSPNCSCPASANFVDNSISICQGSTANIELNFPSGSPTFTIDYSDGTNIFTNQGPYVSGDYLQVTPATTTTYTLTGVTDQNCNTTAFDAITVVVEAPPIAGPDVIEAFCASNAPFNLINLVDGSVASTTGNFFDSGGVQVPGNTINLNSSSSDVYTYEVSATVCSSDQASYTITINDPIAISNILVECNSAQTGYIVSFDIEGGDGNYAVAAGGSYAGTILPGSPVSYESALIPNDTDYTFTISDGSPCSDQIVAGLDPDCDCPAAGSLSGTTSICNGDCATLTFNLQGDGPWDVVYENSLDASNPISLIDISNGHMVTACPSATATYTILSVDDANCSGLVNGLPVTVTVDSPLSVNNLIETCDAVNENYTVSFTVNGGIPGTYQVNPFGQSFVGGAYESFPISSGDPYSFTVSDAGACASVLVEGVFQCVCITDAGTIAPGLIEICEDENLIIPFNGDDVLDGNDGYQFILHEGSETNIGFIVDRYTTATIPAPDGIVFGQTYYITGVAGNTDPFGNVILTDDCTNQTNGIPVIFHAIPSALISGFGTICPGEAVDITVSLTGVGPWIFEYAINAAPQTPVSTTDNEYVFPTTTAGNYTLLSVSDANCVGSVSGLVQVSNFATPTAVLSGDGDVCENSGDGPLVNLTGQAPWTIFYSIDGVESTDPITTFNNQFTIPAEEDGNYTLTLLNDANCVGTVSGALDVTILTAPTALISGGGTVCEGDELPFEVELTGDGPWSVIYSIDGIPQPSITTSDNSYIFSSGVSGDYIITEVNDQSCPGEALDSDAALIVNLLPTAEVLSNQDQICIGQELELIYDLQGTPPFTMTYLLDEDTITLTGLTTDYLEVLQPTTPVFTQVLYVEDSSNPVCSSTPNNSKFIPVGELPDAPILQDDTICSDAGSVQIGVDGVPELDYTWSPADRLSDPKDPNPTFTLGDDDLSPFVRQYTFILTASNGDCVADDTLSITVDPGPRARFTFNPNPVNSEDTRVRFLNQSSPGDEAIYFWEFDSLDTSQEFNPVYEFPGGVIANYTVILTTIDPLTGCIDEWSDIIKVKPEMLVYVPTAFTPDNDGLNDLWRPVLSNIDENDYLLSVYDRFGNTVFETSDPYKAWNGSMNNDDYYVKTGLYVWQIETKNPLSLEKVDFKGTVTVIR